MQLLHLLNYYEYFYFFYYFDYCYYSETLCLILFLIKKYLLLFNDYSKIKTIEILNAINFFLDNYNITKIS